MKTGLLYGIVANTKTRVRCVFCSVYIPKAKKCIVEHTNGVKHKESMELMSENGISLKGEKLHCRPCKKNVQEESIAKHLESEDHANWIAALEDLVDGEFISVDEYLSCEQVNFYCEACMINVLPTLQNVEEHVNGVFHQVNITEHLKPLNGIFPVDNEDEVWCKICDEYVENSIRSILDHIDDDRHHIEWFSRMEELIGDHGISVANYLAYEFENKAYCHKCKAEILCNIDSIEYHITTDAHINSEFS